MKALAGLIAGFVGGFLAANAIWFVYRKRQVCIKGTPFGEYLGAGWYVTMTPGEDYTTFLVNVTHANGDFEARSIVDMINACDVAHGMIDRKGLGIPVS